MNVEERFLVFAYGSLLNRESAQRALKRSLRQEELRPVLIKGFKRSWRAKEQIYFSGLGRVATGVFLDLIESPGGLLNGLLVEVSAAELDQLKTREKNYTCKDISSFVTADNLPYRVVTFVVSPEMILTKQDRDAYVPKKYVEMILSGCRAVGESFLEQYLLSTEAISLPQIDGDYRFIDPQQANFV